MANKKWSITRRERTYQIELIHKPFLGVITIIVNDEIIAKHRDFFENRNEYQFNIGGSDCYIRLKAKGLKYDYELIIDGYSVDFNHSSLSKEEDEWVRIKIIGKNKYIWREGFVISGVKMALLFTLMFSFSMRNDFDIYRLLFILAFSLLGWPFLGALLA